MTAQCAATRVKVVVAIGPHFIVRPAGHIHLSAPQHVLSTITLFRTINCNLSFLFFLFFLVPPSKKTKNQKKTKNKKSKKGHYLSQYYESLQNQPCPLMDHAVPQHNESGVIVSLPLGGGFPLSSHNVLKLCINQSPLKTFKYSTPPKMEWASL